MKYIYLSKGKRAIVDDEDYSGLMEYRWSFNNGYASRQGKSVNYSKREIIYMHQQILGKRAGLEIDHIDRDRLNNRRSNLRHVTRRENMHNKDYSRLYHPISGFKYVYRNRRGWAVVLRVNGERKYIGNFQDSYKAHRAAERARLLYM